MEFERHSQRIWHPASMTHAIMPKVKHEKMELAGGPAKDLSGNLEQDGYAGGFCPGFG
jgi:hypothetical protein